jgi:2-desacetyl-2-hydroxyethyl bacteriochlorophyllide A dehydrogenase
LRVAVVESSNTLIIKNVPEPVCENNKILVDIRAASVCNGTDLHIIQGIHPGSSPFPCTLGHEGAGVVLEVGSEISEFVPGDRVAIREWGNACFADKVLCPPESLVHIPDDMSFEDASLLEMLTAVYATVSQAMKVGDTVAILGQGAAGLMMTQVAKAAGANGIIVSEPAAHKRELALQLGADVAIDPNDVDAVQAILDFTRGVGADIVFEAAGVKETVFTTVEMVRHRGTIAQFGVYCHEAIFRFDWLHFKAAQVIATGYSGGYRKSSHEHALNLVKRGQVNLEPLITHYFRLNELNNVFELLANGDQSIIKAIIYP